MAKRVQLRPKDLKEPDPFLETVDRVVQYVRANRTRVTVAASGILVLFLATVGWTSYRDRRIDRAAATLARATEAIDTGAYEAARTGLSSVIAEGVEPFAAIARLYLAGIAEQQGSYEEAIQTYDAAGRSDVPEYLRQAALLGKAAVLERTKRPLEAAKAYRAAARLEGPHTEQALRGQLRTAQAAEQTELAREALERLLDKFPGAADADELSARLEELSASAQSSETRS